MSKCRLIVCEKTSHWSAALRGCVNQTKPQIVETRSLAACEAELSQSPASLVALETTAGNVETIVRFITSVNQRFPRAAAIALLAADAEGAAMLLREAGAIDAVASVLELPRIARLARRQLRQVPDEPLRPEQFVAERLPWSAHATGSGPAR